MPEDHPAAPGGNNPLYPPLNPAAAQKTVAYIKVAARLGVHQESGRSAACVGAARGPLHNTSVKVTCGPTPRNGRSAAARAVSRGSGEGHVRESEENLPTAGCELLGISPGSVARPRSNSFLGGVDPPKETGNVAQQGIGCAGLSKMGHFGRRIDSHASHRLGKITTWCRPHAQRRLTELPARSPTGRGDSRSSTDRSPSSSQHGRSLRCFVYRARRGRGSRFGGFWPIASGAERSRGSFSCGSAPPLVPRFPLGPVGS
jgi:hypothetical protein